MIKITSANNETVKRAAKLLNKKYRDSENMFLAEGARIVEDIRLYDPGLVEKIFIAESAAEKNYGDIILPDILFSKLCETDNSQGIVAVIRKPSAKPENGYSLFLDRVRDPGNVGTLIRTAAAVGFNDIYLFDCADAYSGKVVRSTMSAIIKVNIFENIGFDAAKKLKENGYTLLCADMNGVSSYEYRARNDKVCLVIGNEANGVSGELKALCGINISLPMSGKIESLNAAVSGGILMYNIKYLK